MRIAEHVQCAIDHMEAGKFDPALLHACIAIDATAKRRSPQQKVRSRYVQCIRDYYWLVEPMLGAGIKKVYALGTYFLSLGEVHYLIDAWWGREKEFRPIADAQNQVRVKFEGLTTHGWSADGPIGTLRVVQPGYGPRAT